MPSSSLQQHQKSYQKSSSSSSARPRLVEEGEPIYDYDDGGRADDQQQHTNTTRSSLATSEASTTKATPKTNTFYSVGGSSTDHYHDDDRGGDHDMTRKTSSPSSAAGVVATKPGGGGEGGIVVSSLQRAAMKSNIKIKEDRTKLGMVTTATDDDSRSLGFDYYHRTPVASISSSRPTVTSTSYVIGGDSSSNGGGARSYDQQNPSYQHQVYHPHHNYQHHHQNDSSKIGNNFRDAGHQATIVPPGHLQQEEQHQQQQQHSYFNRFTVAGNDVTQGHAHVAQAYGPQTGQFAITPTIPPAVTATQQQHHKDDDDGDDMMIMTDSDGDMNHYHQPHHRHQQHNQTGHQDQHRNHYQHHQHQHQRHVMQRSYEIGNNQAGSAHYQHQQEPSYPQISHANSAATGGGGVTIKAERMEGVEDHSEKPEIVVLDGANVAYAYAEVNSTVVSGPGAGLSTSTTRKAEPDVRGIQVAADHFLMHGVRVLVVLPQYFWKSTKFRPLAEDQLEILHSLKARGLLVPSPPADDDDAYAITIAQREDSKSQRFPDRIKPGYVLSNDMFRDAQDRDETGNLRRWLQAGRHPDYGPGRISYTFFDNQSMNDRGEHVLDFQPNPRHPLVERLFRQS